MLTIPLSKGFSTVVDDDCEWLLVWPWHVTFCGSNLNYAARSGRIKGRSFNFYMHRAILNPEPTMYVDHIDGNGLNNTRANLRICSPQQNGARPRRKPNFSGYRGVYWHAAGQKWEAQITPRGITQYLGVFSDPIEAARAYDKAAHAAWGEFARLNFEDS